MFELRLGKLTGNNLNILIIEATREGLLQQQVIATTQDHCFVECLWELHLRVLNMEWRDNLRVQRVTE